MISRRKTIRPFFLRRTMKFNLQHINTAISSAPHNESDIRISFGSTNMKDHEVIVVEYLGERRFFEVCRKKLEHTVYQSQWIPFYPQLLAVATNNINIYDYQDRELSLRSSLLTKQDGNPVISIDWNRRNPEVTLATRLDGQLTIMRMEYGRTDAEMMVKSISPSLYLWEPSCGARFGTGIMGKCIITADKNGQVLIFDEKLRATSYKFIKNILGIEFANHNEHLVALRNTNIVCIYDVRNLNQALSIYSRFCVNEFPTCLCWSPHSPALYIGTSQGEIIKWRTDTAITERCTNVEKKFIANIHIPVTACNLLLATSIDLPDAPYATCVEAYLN